MYKELGLVSNFDRCLCRNDGTCEMVLCEMVPSVVLSVV